MRHLDDDVIDRRAEPDQFRSIFTRRHYTHRIDSNTQHAKKLRFQDMKTASCLAYTIAQTVQRRRKATDSSRVTTKLFFRYAGVHLSYRCCRHFLFWPRRPLGNYTN